MELKDLLRVMVDKEGSDLFLSTGAPPSMKAHGKLVPMTDKALPQGYTRKIANQVMNEDQRKEFEEKPGAYGRRCWSFQGQYICPAK